MFRLVVLPLGVPSFAPITDFFRKDWHGQPAIQKMNVLQYMCTREFWLSSIGLDVDSVGDSERSTPHDIA